MDSSRDIYRQLPVRFDELLEAMAEMERRGEDERVEEMRSMLSAVKPAAVPHESRRDRRARERREAKAMRKASYTPDPKFNDRAFRALILSPYREAEVEV